MQGVHRPGYLPQQGHRLTQFSEPGCTRDHARPLLPSSLLPGRTQHSRVLRTSITRRESGLNRIKMQLSRLRAAYTACGIESQQASENKWLCGWRNTRSELEKKIKRTGSSFFSCPLFLLSVSLSFTLFFDNLSEMRATGIDTS